ncbi:MAG: hypothetical protein U9O98_06490 [Asgard group archaeon]|nr:hypothetical protein [Asgard group archaeon]
MSKTIIIEPHFSDAAWSTGGLIAKNPEEYMIVTIFSSNKFFSRFRNKNFNNRDLRRAERKFLRKLGVTHKGLGFNKDTDRKRDLSEIFHGSLKPAEQEMIPKIAKKLRKLYETYQPEVIYAPMAVDHRIDHTIVKKAIQHEPYSDIIFYEDFPNFSDENRKNKYNYEGFELLKEDISDVINKKIDGIFCFKRLIKAFYTNPQILQKSLKQNPYELYWKETED